MSAPSRLDDHLLAQAAFAGFRPLPAHPAPGTGQYPSEQQVDRRSQDPAARLSRRHDALCRSACDPLEIAAVLEAEGISDHHARVVYGFGNVFELAEHLWDAVPWRLRRRNIIGDAWNLTFAHAQLRGLTYAMPVIVMALLPRIPVATIGIVVLLAASFLTVAAAQCLSAIAHLLTGRHQFRALAGLTRTALIAALVAGGVTTAVCVAVGLPIHYAALPAVQWLMVVAVTLLIVRRRERLLASLLVPAGLVLLIRLAGIDLDTPLSLPQGATAIATAVITLAALTVAAWRTARPADGEPLRSAVGRIELAFAGKAGIYGLGLSGLIFFGVLAVSLNRVTGSYDLVLLSSLPLIVTIGTSEYLLHRSRRTCAELLGASRVLHAFGRMAERQLRLMLGTQALAAAITATAVVVLLHRLHAEPVMNAYAAGYGLLSVALLMATTLLSLGQMSTAATLIGLAGMLICLPVFATDLSQRSLITLQLGVIVALMVAVYPVTRRHFVLASAHR